MHYGICLICMNILIRHSLIVSDFQPDVHFYWLRGETVVPRGHRRGRIDPFRFQIDDKPRCQIRIRKQLSEVQIFLFNQQWLLELLILVIAEDLSVCFPLLHYSWSILPFNSFAKSIWVNLGCSKNIVEFPKTADSWNFLNKTRDRYLEYIRIEMLAL